MSAIQKLMQKELELISKDTKIFLIKQNERDEDLLLEATKMHIATTKSLWHIKFQKYINIIFQDMNIDSYMNE